MAQFHLIKDVHVYGTEYKKDSARANIVAWAWYEAVSVKEIGCESLFKPRVYASGVCFVTHFSTVRVYASMQTSGKCTNAKEKEG